MTIVTVLINLLYCVVISVLLPLVWQHRQRFDQRQLHAFELALAVIDQFRQYQRQRNQIQQLTRTGHTVNQSLSEQFAQFESALNQLQQFTQPWFSVDFHRAHSLRNQLKIYAIARSRDPSQLIDLREAELEVAVFQQLQAVRQQILRHSYVSYTLRT